MRMRENYNHTIYACFIGYIVQAIVNNFVPLLFLTLQHTYDISMDQVALLVTFNFGVQLVVDMLASRYADKIGHRKCIVVAHICGVVGLVGLTVLPELFANHYIGIVLAVSIYAVGGGLLEVLVSPIVEACPTQRKDATMSLLHSFYCWGHVGVVLLSTLFFSLFGIENWRYLALAWALIPLCNMFYFLQVPIAPLIAEGEEQLSMKGLLQNKIFWVMVLLMICAGASEQAVSQWASAFAESGLGVSKTVGDLAGPLVFATLMGCSRAFYGEWSEKIDLERFMLLSGILCVGSYFLTALSGNPLLGFMGVGLCGLSVGIMWPGTFSLAAKRLPAGGTAMFAFFALAGDIGCASGPTFVGVVAGLFSDKLQMGILIAVIFPILLIIGLILNKAAVAAE